MMIIFSFDDQTICFTTTNNPHFPTVGDKWGLMHVESQATSPSSALRVAAGIKNVPWLLCHGYWLLVIGVEERHPF